MGVIIGKVSHEAANHNKVDATNVEVVNPGGKAGVFLACDHASRAIPVEYDNLGLAEADLSRHIAWDIGAAALTWALSEMLDAPAVLAPFSRLLIDVNRDPACDSLIPAASDGVAIPGNAEVTAAERQLRIERYYDPFHHAVERQVKTMIGHRRTPLVIGVHSFTPVMNGIRRPWLAGMLWNRDHRLAKAFINALRGRGLMTGDNEPYSGRTLFYTMDRHGAAHGLPQATLEIRQDEIGDAAGVARWAKIIAEVIGEISRHPELKKQQYFA